MESVRRDFMKARRVHILLLVLPAVAAAQLRDYRVHTRSMMHQTVYNTGELGRAYSSSGTVEQGEPSMEWPPNSAITLDRIYYPGQHNSFGSGLWVAGTRGTARSYSFCGAVSDGNGNSVPVEGVYSNPISIIRTENYPILADGSLNPAYDPNEAEETITTRWHLLSSGVDAGMTVTRTSRAWSFPGYDGFIIYEYDVQNTSADTLYDVHICFANSFCPSMFGFMRGYNRWAEADYRGQPPNGTGNTFSRFDLHRWMTYTHDRDGKPDSVYFNQWSQLGDRGGLNSPQAVGLEILHYDYDHIAHRGETRQIWASVTDSIASWDSNGRMKQPFLYRYENGNLSPSAKTQPWLDPAVFRKSSPAQGANDSLYYFDQYNPADPYYWIGRAKASTNLSWWQPVNRALGFYPYVLPPDQILHFSLAEVVGYGPGVAGDRIYKDAGGVTRDGIDIPANPYKMYFNPVPSLYDTLQYPYLGTVPYIGSRYLQDHPLPWYVTAGVVSIRDVADRAIQVYTGQPLMKHDTVQFEPISSPPNGAYNTIPIPVPSPAIDVATRRDTTNASVFNTIAWKASVESFSVPRLRAPLARYSVLKAPEPLGPWKQLDTVGRRDPRYFTDSVYVFRDDSTSLGQVWFYAVVSVDMLGGKSGMTNLTRHETVVTGVGERDAIPARFALEQNYPNPFNPSTRIRFSVDRTARTTLEVFDLLGRKVLTPFDDVAISGIPYEMKVDCGGLASGAYIYRLRNGNRIESKKLILVK